MVVHHGDKQHISWSSQVVRASGKKGVAPVLQERSANKKPDDPGRG